ncbi:MAG: DegT/DnrJ/EryC1/StrS family aminotransferase [Deferribacterales bacterium]
MVQKQSQNSINEKIRLSKPYLGDKRSLMVLIEEILENGLLVQGKYVAQFEQLVADYLHVKHAVAVSSGTAALHLSLIALGIGPEDEVIVPAYTFPATANVVELVGAKPVLVDVDLETYNLLIDQIEKSITSKTKAIIPVHLFGNPLDMDPIMEIAKEYNLWVIEDAAGALGSAYKGRKCGTIGNLGCFSFHPRKVLTTAEGGMVVTNDDDLAEKVRVLRNHGMKVGKSKVDFIVAGFNYRMNEIEAVLGIAQMREIQDTISERQKLAELYVDALKGISSISFQKTILNSTSVWQAFVVRFIDKDSGSILKLLQDTNIEANIGTYALHLLEFYSNKYGYKPSDYPNATELYRRSLALPFYNRMTSESVKEVSATLRRIVYENRAH